MRHDAAVPEAGGGPARASREADGPASRPTPLTLVAGAVAGDDLATVAATAAAFLGCPVAIVVPALGAPVVAPPDALVAGVGEALAATAQAALDGEMPRGDAVAVRIADEVVGIVAAIESPGEPPGGGLGVEPLAPTVSGRAHSGGTALPTPSAVERRAWLEAAAAAASVTALIRDALSSPTGPGADALIAELAAGAPTDLPGLLGRARRLGHDLSGGAVAVSARRDELDPSPSAEDPVAGSAGALLARRGGDRLLALVPNGAEPGRPRALDDLLAGLVGAGWTASVSAPRRDPGSLHEAIAEAELLGELRAGDAARPGREDTHRLLIGVLLRDRGTVEELCAETVAPLADYDRRHDTDLLATLRAFLRHDGSTTETAEAMALHRHTVGYRLSRVHEVSGLSPYESDGRERLSLGIKAAQILEAERRRGPAG